MAAGAEGAEGQKWFDDCVTAGLTGRIPRSFEYCSDATAESCQTKQEPVFCHDAGCFEANLVADMPAAEVDPQLARPAEAQSSGYVFQRVRVGSSGVYMLKFFVGDASGTTEPPEFLARVTDVDSGKDLVRSVARPGVFSPVTLFLNVSTPQANLEIAFAPSAEDCAVMTGGAEGSTPNPECQLGEIWLGNIQLSRLDDRQCASPEECQACAQEVACQSELPVYTATSFHRSLAVACPSRTSAALLDYFKRECRSSLGMACYPDIDRDCNCYREVTFALQADQIDSGELFYGVPVANKTYNFRHERLAVNFVGEDVFHCPDGRTGDCQYNRTVPYRLEHSGHNVPVRNWDGDIIEFDLPTGRIEPGPGVASGLVIATPMESEHDSALTGYWKSELRGRPLAGLYTLRVWETPGLQWSQVADVQLVFDYRYWTRQGE